MCPQTTCDHIARKKKKLITKIKLQLISRIKSSPKVPTIKYSEADIEVLANLLWKIGRKNYLN